MTRANINFIGEWQGEYPDRGRNILAFYWNGDQYPSGIRDIYKLDEFLESSKKEVDFREWALQHYEDVQIEEVEQPRVYFTGTFITDYSYVFDPDNNHYMVWNWGELKFEGGLDEFKEWLKEQE